MHPNHAPRELRRLGALDWRLDVVTTAPQLSPPGGGQTTGGTLIAAQGTRVRIYFAGPDLCGGQTQPISMTGGRIATTSGNPDDMALLVVGSPTVATSVTMRGNGAVVAAPSLEQAVVLTWYLEDAARIELQLRMAGLAEQAGVIAPDAAAQRAVGAGRIYERMWDYLTDGDAERAESGSLL